MEVKHSLHNFKKLLHYSCQCVFTNWQFWMDEINKFNLENKNSVHETENRLLKCDSMIDDKTLNHNYLISLISFLV